MPSTADRCHAHWLPLLTVRLRAYRYALPEFRLVIVAFVSVMVLISRAGADLERACHDGCWHHSFRSLQPDSRYNLNRPRITADSRIKCTGLPIRKTFACLQTFVACVFRQCRLCPACWTGLDLLEVPSGSCSSQCSRCPWDGSPCFTCSSCWWVQGSFSLLGREEPSYSVS